MPRKKITLRGRQNIRWRTGSRRFRLPLSESARKEMARVRQQEMNDALLKAVIRYDKAAAKDAIEKGADVDHRSDSGLTPLMWACRGGLDEMAKLLIEHGADINAKDIYGRRPLDFAMGEDHSGIVAMLEERGAASGTEKL